MRVRAASARRGAAGRSLFFRIFALLFGSLVVMQVLNALLVLVTPPPAPHFFSFDQVERALKGGESEAFRRVERPTPSFDASDDPIGRILADRLAARMHVPREAVQVRTMRPRWSQRGAQAPHFPQALPLPDAFVGRFEVALRTGNARWTVVSPAGIEMEFWRRRALLTLLLALLIAAPIAWWLSRRLARPIAAFGAAAERLGRDPSSSLIEVSGPPEVADAAAAFNDMQTRLQRYIADRTLMLGAVAHDMRTPLMRMALHLEDAPASLRSAVEGEVDDMQAMLGAVLAFVRDQERPSRRSRLDLRAIVESVASVLADQGERIEVAESEALIIEGDPAAIKSLVANLLRNAVDHGGGAAEVVLGAGADEVWLEVRDRGPGLAEPMLESVFEPFARGEQSRSRQTGGMGLGLASARAVARGHGGDVTLANRAGGGLIARLELPR